MSVIPLVAFLLMITPVGLRSEIPPDLAEADPAATQAPWPKQIENKNSGLSEKFKNYRSLPLKMHRQEWADQPIQGAGMMENPPLQMAISDWGDRENGWNAKTSWNRMDADARIRASHDRIQTKESSQAKKEILQVADLTEPMETTRSPEWSSRKSRVGQTSSGRLIMYEGRLTRIRESFWREEEKSERSLGGQKKERFSPEEVETLLQNPHEWDSELAEKAASTLQTKGQPQSGFRPATGDN